MKYNSLIIGLSVLALQSCTDNLVYTGTDIEVVLTGNTYQAAFTESSPVSTFNSGNQILLNASGSLQIDNRILTYMDNQWKAENEFSWSDLTGKTNVTAVYPVYPDLDYVQENLYKNNSLEDILYVKDEFPAGNSIHLQFKHLFSLLTLHLEGNLQTYFQKIEVTCPAVSSIIPKSAEIVLADNGNTYDYYCPSFSFRKLFVYSPSCRKHGHRHKYGNKWKEIYNTTRNKVFYR